MNIRLHKKQSIAFASKATEILYGGAAGGGKSFFLRVKAADTALRVNGAQIYIFRRFYGDLIKNYINTPGGFRELLDPYISAGKCKICESAKRIKFSNGSVINLCQCARESEVYKYQGAEIHLLLIDELTHFTEATYKFLRSRCRIPKFFRLNSEIPLPAVIACSNPGGTGHNWVKAAFIDTAPELEIHEMPAEEGGMMRQYIPAKLSDNPSLDFESYSRNLSGLGSPWLVRAMLDGDWNIVCGGMWDDVWNPEKHIVRPFEIPRSWRIDRSLDWGYSKPWSAGFWAESDGTDYISAEGASMPTVRGDLFRIGEIYGWTGVPDAGDRASPADAARRIREKEHLLGISGRVLPGPADNSIFNGDTSVGSKMEAAGIRWTRSDKSPGSRKRGWMIMRDRLRNAALNNGEPGMKIFNTCLNFIRTIPALERLPRDPDDIDTAAEDHIADETRYRLLSARDRTTSGIIF